MAFMAIAGTIALAGCETEDLSPTGARAMRPLSAEMTAEIEKRNMPKESPILVRIFKEEAELEVWKQDANGQFAHLKTYPICRWSGELGPKVKEGDRQAPEGFYTITPGQMNPNSNYYLAFNLGFPNAYDRANDRTGAFLMVHGDCSSSGCYAMTDDQIQEIYALGRDSFMGGQKSFQVQAYPFRMTGLNLAKHRNNPAMPFWRMIKEGNDHFEVTKTEPRVDVCDKHYVFDAVAPGGASTPLAFRAREKCPVFEIPADVAAAVKDKQDRDERAFTDYSNRGIAMAPGGPGPHGGMHPAFLAKLHPAQSIFDRDGRGSDVNVSNIKLPPNVNPPRTPEPDQTASVMPAEQSSRSGSEQPSTLQKMGKWFGLGGGEATAAPAPTPAKPKPAVATAPAAKPAVATAAAHPAPAGAAPTGAQPAAKPAAEVAHAATPAPKTPPSTASAYQAPPAANNPNLMAGATPVVPSGSFEGRWDGVR
jgi:murein L,D-transpeptidase YafK